MCRKPGGEGEPDLGLHGNLIHTLELVLDGILDRQDLSDWRVDLVESGVERGRLARPSRARHQEDAMGKGDEPFESATGRG